MMHEDGHPDVSLKDWKSFVDWQKTRISPSPIEEVIDRNKAGCLPDWFVPLARGVAIASDTLLREAGYHHGMYRPHGWREYDCDCFMRDIDGTDDLLMVRRCAKHQWWTIERLGASRRYEDEDEVLVFQFASVPIFTRSYQSAMQLAMHCHTNGPPSGLLWIKTTPDNKEALIELARRRQTYEAFCATLPSGHVH